MRVIEDGLKPEDSVVVKGLQRAIPGAKVTPQQAQAEKLLRHQSRLSPHKREINHKDTKNTKNDINTINKNILNPL
jgi:hypothetical protein